MVSSLFPTAPGSRRKPPIGFMGIHRRRRTGRTVFLIILARQVAPCMNATEYENCAEKYFVWSITVRIVAAHDSPQRPGPIPEPGTRFANRGAVGRREAGP